MDSGGTEAKLRDYLKRVTAELGQTRNRLKQAEDAAGEPIAIIGMACRLPGGVHSPDDLWRLVDAGADAVAPFPADRGWDLDDNELGYRQEAALLHDVADFDAAFFGITPREALGMDPQQRLLLETSWEAIERAGIDARGLKGRQVGVYVGVVDNAYLSGLVELPESLKGYRITGTTTSVVSGRIAYHLGLAGPAVSVDTACSSSLTGLHLAIQALRAGHCELAVTGGVSVLPSTMPFDDFARQGGLAKDARIKPFSAAADGTNWGEGAGVLVVERLSDARRNNRHILAVVRGSAVNQDGASNGLTAPNDLAQERVIKAALADARLTSADVDAVEAHGTGTPLGDPLEAKALLATYGRGRAEDRPLWLGSVKSNLGHSSASAGVTGIIKIVQSMRHGTLPKTINVDELSPNVDWSAGGVRLLTEAREWTAIDRPRRAAVSGFGISGTNAHVIVEEASAEDGGTEAPNPGAPAPFVLWPVSGKSAPALAAQAERLLSHREADGDTSSRDVGYTLATARVPFAERAVVVAGNDAEHLDGLRAIMDGTEVPHVVRDSVGDGKTAFLFTGQGSQRPGMGRELYDAYPAFAAAFDEVCLHLDPHLDRPLRDVVFGDDPAPVNQTSYTQPALFAVEVALFRLLESWGITPDYLNGHSIGEISAAHVAGVFSLSDACTLVAARGRLMQELPGGGAMVAVQATEDEVRPLLNPRADIATINGPRSIVVSGDEDAVAAIATEFGGKGRKTKRLTVSHAFHSPRMEGMLDAFRDVAKRLDFHPPRIPIVTNLTGAVAADSELCDPEFWVRHVRDAVRFADGARALSAAGVTTFVELGPDGILSAAVADSVDDAELRCFPVLRPDRPEAQTLSLALARAHARGVTVDWDRYYAGSGARLVDLPTYAFQRQRFWAESAESAGDVAAAGIDASEHGLLGGAVRLADADEWLFTGRLSAKAQSWLPDHAVADDILLPGTGFVDMAWHVGALTGCPRIAELTLQAPLVLPEDGTARIQVAVKEPDDAGHRAITIHGRLDDEPDAAWTCHAVGSLAPAAPVTDGAGLTQWPPAGGRPLDVSGFYDKLDELGYGYGPAFQCVTAAWRMDDALYFEVSAADRQAGEADRYGIHPALLDAAVHGFLLYADMDDLDELVIPFTWSGVELFAPGATDLRVRVRPGDNGPRDVTLADGQGRVVARMEALEVRPIPGKAPGGQAKNGDLITAEWAPLDNTVDGEVGWEYLAGSLEVRAPLPDPAPEVAVVRVDSHGREAAGAVSLALELVREWLADDRRSQSLLAFALRGDTPVQAAIAGLVRSANSENPGRFGLIYTETGHPDCTTEIAATLRSGEPEVRIRGGELAVRRLRRRGPRPTLRLPADDGWRMGTAETGGYDVLPATAATVPLEADQVRVAVAAAGLNFRDLVISLDMVSDMDNDMGLEGAGVVTEVGSQVTDLAVGDRVMGMLRDCMAPVAITHRREVVRLPDDWTFAQGAAIPVAFMTCWLTLVDLAAVKPGERVLIHSGTGGVGLAAIQIARHLGAEVFVTASPPKQHLLRELGLDEAHIASTRTLDFRDHFMAATGGEGVDVVLNTLAGEFTDASLELLPRGGRFVELGKTDVRDTDAVAAAYPGVRYDFFNLDHRALGDEVAVAWRRLAELFDSGELRLPLLETWPIGRAPEAIDRMRRAAHLGKLVFTMPRAWDADKTVLITGGTGTLGGMLARHLVTRHGVRHLVLTSRRGPAAEGAAELKSELEAEGARVDVVACDVGDRDAVRRLLADVPQQHPLGTVIHTAGIVDDALVTDLTPGHIARVMRSKADAAAHLDELTAGLPLDDFILFSSAAGTIGAPGQANYAAANSYLDELARDRRRRGLPAVSVAWGIWERASGMTGHLGQQDLARMARTGVTAIGDTEGMALFDAAVEVDEPAVVAVKLNQKALREQSQAGALPGILTGLVTATPVRSARRTRTGQPDDIPLEQRLAGLSGEERAAAVLDLVRSEAVTVLQLSGPDELAPQREFRDVGVDSLTGVELRNRLNRRTGLRLPASVVLDHSTPAELAREIDSQLPESFGTAVSGTAPAPRSSPGAAGTGIGGLLLSAALDDGRVEQARTLAIDLAALRPEFTDPHDVPADSGIRSLKDGEPTGPLAVCLAPYLGQPNSFHYVELAKNLPPSWSAVALSLTGFRDGEPLPSSLDVALEALARRVRHAAAGRRFVLIGHSGGGNIGGALAAHLSSGDTRPDALVALDPPPWDPTRAPQWYPTLYGALSALEASAGVTDDGDAWITAQARYGNFDYEVPRIDVPTLVVHAAELLDGLGYEKNRWQVTWKLPHDEAEVPGDHFTMMQSGNAVACARVVTDWFEGKVSGG